MKKSLKKRLCMTGVALIVAFVLLNIVFTYFGLASFTSYLTARQMKKTVTSLKEQYDENDEFESYIAKIDEDYNIKVTIIDEDKKVIMTTISVRKKQKAIGKSAMSLFDENIDALNAGEVASVYKPYDNSKKDVLIIVIQKIGADRYAVLSRSFRSLHNATYAAIWFDMIIGFVIIVIGFFVVFRLSSYLVKPINEMKKVAEHISNLEFNKKVTRIGEDELGQLGISINRMSSHLESNVEQMQNDIENRKRLVRNISHEIKSPVAVIMGYADRMKVVLQKDPEKAQKYCEIISNESVRIDELVKEMLEFSKLEQRMEMIKPEAFLVKTLFENIHIRIAEEYLEKPILFAMDYAETDSLTVDYGLLERAVYNLVNNGISYSTDCNVQITMSGYREGAWYRIKVHNTGSHIPENEIDCIWDAFYKVDKARVRNRNGCGIGLSIVKEIVEAHHGTYAAENDEKGVSFVISLPMC